MKLKLQAGTKRNPHYEDHPGPGMRKAMAAVKAGKVKEYESGDAVMAEVEAIRTSIRHKKAA